VKSANPAITERQLQSAMLWYYKERKAVRPRNECDEGDGEIKIESSWNGGFSFTTESWRQEEEAKSNQNQHNSSLSVN